MEEDYYKLQIGDIVCIEEWGWGFVEGDIGKYVEVVGFGEYFGEDGIDVVPYDCVLETENRGYEGSGVVGFESFGDNPLVLLNTKQVPEYVPPQNVEGRDEYSLQHYDILYQLTEQDIDRGHIKVDAYWVAKQWKTGSRDDSGALWHSLKTIARFGEKNSKEREIKALYNQAKALARIYNVELE